MNGRWEMFKDIVSALGKDRIRVLETGVSDKPSDGLSTVFWSQCPLVEGVVSVDLSVDAWIRLRDRGLIEVAEKCMLVRAHTIMGIAALPNESFDIVYLDSDMDPELMLYEAMAALPKMRFPGVILLDDLDTKGHRIMSFFRGQTQPFKYAPYGAWRAVTPATMYVKRPHGTIGMAAITLAAMPEVR